MLKMSNQNILEETEQLIKIMKKHFRFSMSESKGTAIVFNKLKGNLDKIYLRPNNIIDTSLYSEDKIERALNDIGDRS